jgi:hypothetical protein
MLKIKHSAAGEDYMRVMQVNEIKQFIRAIVCPNKRQQATTSDIARLKI